MTLIYPYSSLVSITWNSARKTLLGLFYDDPVLDNGDVKAISSYVNQGK